MSPTVTGLTASTARSHDEQVPFSRRISTVLTEGQGGGPYRPHPAPTGRGHGRSGSRRPRSPRQRAPRPRTVPGPGLLGPDLLPASSPSQDCPAPAPGSQRTGWTGRPGTPDPARHRPLRARTAAPCRSRPGPRPALPLRARAPPTSCPTRGWRPKPSPPRPDRRAVSITAWSSSGPPPPRPGAPTASHPCQAGGRRPPPGPGRPCPGRPRPRQASRSRPRSRRRPDPASSPPP